MRRAQVDQASQPVRNLIINPLFKTTSGETQVRANLCPNPRMTNSNFGGYGTGTQTLTNVTGLATNPEGITTGVRTTYTAGAVNPGIIVFPLPEHSMTYTVSGWVFNEGTVSESIAIALKGASSGGAQTVPPGVWTRLSWTYTTQASGLTAGNDFGFRIGSPTANGSFLTTGVLIEKSMTLNNYFDGNTAATTEFRYAWGGTAHNSVSYIWGKNVTAQLRSSGGDSSRQKFYGYQSFDPLGAPIARWVTPAGSATSTWRVAGIGAGSFKWQDVKAGQKYTLGFNYRPAGYASGTMSIMIAEGGSTNPVVNYDATQPLTPATWKQYRRTFTALRDMTTSHQLYISLPTTSDPAVDQTLDFNNFFLVEGEYTGDFIHGGNLFSKWDGTADASVSVGYPPQLLDLAGKPSVDLSTGSTGGVAIPVDPFTPRTIYLCYETYGNAQNYPNFGYYGQMSTKGLTFQTGSAGNNNLYPRLDFPGGNTNIGVTHVSGRLVRRHVVVFTFPQGLASATSCLNGGADRTDSWNAGTGWDDGRAGLATAGDGKGLRMLVYYAEHDRPTRLAISRYLGNKYGAPVA